jgi:hypothetical protein
MMPPVARCVLGVDEEERDEKDAGLSILHGVHRRGTYDIVSIELLPAARGGPRNGPSPGLAHVCKL